MKILSPFFLLCVIALPFGTIFLAKGAQGPQQQRSIDRLPFERNEPLRIRAVRVKNKRVLRGSKFDSGDNWLQDLRVTIKNRTHKRILFASIDLLFPAPLGSGGLPATDQIDYGNRALFSRPPSREEMRAGIEPGQEVEIQLNAIGYNRVRSLLADTGYPEARRVFLGVRRVIFEDDTSWYAGALFRRDSIEPGKWINTEALSQGKQTPGNIRNTRQYVGYNGVTFRPTYTDQSMRIWSSLFQPSTPARLETSLLHSSSTPMSSSLACYQITSSVDMYCYFGGLGCKTIKDSTDMTAGSYIIQSVNAACTDSVGDYCGQASSTQRILCVFPGGGGGGGGGGLEDFNNGYGESCTLDSDCDFGLYCDWATNTCQS